MVTTENSSPLYGDGETALYLRTLDVLQKIQFQFPASTSSGSQLSETPVPRYLMYFLSDKTLTHI